MEGRVSINGELYPPHLAKVPVFDRGFLFGDSVFEVMRTYGGEPFREREHLLRLFQSCERVHIPITWSMESVSRDLHRTISDSGLSECYVRVMVTRGEGPLGLDLAEARMPNLLIFALPLRTLPEQLYEQGIAVGLVHIARATDGTSAAGAKTSNYLSSVLALHQVKQRGCHEAVVVGPLGEVVEGATSNIFVVRGGELRTPPVGAGILAGITRKVVLELATHRGSPCHEANLHPADLYRADEVFITSSVREIVPVVRVDDVVIGDGHPGPLTRALRAAYRAETTTTTLTSG
jgi:branched-chain amino acid aminotransferase